jgi:hypothetical protein
MTERDCDLALPFDEYIRVPQPGLRLCHRLVALYLPIHSLRFFVPTIKRFGLRVRSY